jgi:hypothetical protein
MERFLIVYYTEENPPIKHARVIESLDKLQASMKLVNEYEEQDLFAGFIKIKYIHEIYNPLFSDELIM